MEISPLVIAIVAAIASILSIATTAIGLKNKELNKSDRGFLVFNVVANSLVLIVCLVYFGLKLKNRGSTSLLAI